METKCRQYPSPTCTMLGLTQVYMAWGRFNRIVSNFSLILLRLFLWSLGCSERKTTSFWIFGQPDRHIIYLLSPSLQEIASLKEAPEKFLYKVLKLADSDLITIAMQFNCWGRSNLVLGSYSLKCVESISAKDISRVAGSIWLGNYNLYQSQPRIIVGQDAVKRPSFYVILLDLILNEKLTTCPCLLIISKSALPQNSSQAYNTKQLNCRAQFKGIHSFMWTAYLKSHHNATDCDDKSGTKDKVTLRYL